MKINRKRKTARIRKFFALSLAVLTALQLVSCGSSSGDNGAIQKEFVYVPEYVELENVNWFNSACGTSEGIYYSTTNWNETTGENKTSVFFLNGSTKEVKELPMDLKTGMEEGASADVQQMAVLSDGSLAIVVGSWKVTNPETYEGEQAYYLKIFSAEDGSVLAEADITKDITELDEYAYIQYMLADGEDNIYMTSGNNKILVYGKDCKKAFDLDMPTDSWIQDMGVSKEGHVVYSIWDQTAQGNTFNVIDAATRSVSKTCKTNVPDTRGNKSIVPGFEKGILVNSSSGLVEYDLETETVTEVLDWLDSDINTDYVSYFTALKDGRILALTNDYSVDTPKNEAVFLTKTPYSEMPEREIITLGVMYTSQEVNSAVINFNKSNDMYRIQVIDYGSNYSDEEEYQDALAKFNNALTSGNGPDIFDVNIVNMQMMAQKGVMEDLTPYLEADETLNREDMFESVLKAFSVNDKLYCIPTSFYIQTVIGKTAEVGETPGWTLDDLMALMESKPEGTEVFDYATREYILQMCMMYNFDSFINWETGECNLDGEEFVKVLEFANRFESQEDYQYDEDAPSTPSKIQDGTLMLMSTSFSSVQEYQMQSAMFGEPITMIGYPTTKGTGSAISGQNTYAMNAKSKNKEAAWEFIKYFISEDFYEDNHVWGFPTLISEYNKVNEEYMTPEYYTDENGNQVEQSKGGWGWDDFYVDLYAATQEEVDAVTELINGCDRSYSYDTQLIQIITEEAAPFFEGQKGAQEVADIIQSRVKMYVNENR